MKYLILVPLAFLITACTTFNTPPLSFSQKQFFQQSPQIRKERLHHLQHWSIEGAVSLKQGSHHLIAHYAWQQNLTHFNLQISSPLNFFLIRLIGNPAQTQLLGLVNQGIEKGHLNQIMQRHLGWYLPISSLVDWIKGLPTQGSKKAKWDHYGHLVELMQQGWLIKYLRYQHTGSYDLPDVIELSGHHTQLKLIITNWQIGSPACCWHDKSHQ